MSLDVTKIKVGKKVKYCDKKYTIKDYYNQTGLVKLSDDLVVSIEHVDLIFSNDTENY